MSGSAPVVLLMEDEPLIAMDIELLLESAGFSVTTVMSCAEANGRLTVLRPDIVVVDIMLRDGPCHDVVRALIEQQIPFIVHSGDHPSMHADTPFMHGRWIGKPAAPRDLIEEARALLVGPARPTSLSGKPS